MVSFEAKSLILIERKQSTFLCDSAIELLIDEITRDLPVDHQVTVKAEGRIEDGITYLKAIEILHVQDVSAFLKTQQSRTAVLIT